MKERWKLKMEAYGTMEGLEGEGLGGGWRVKGLF
jgi:hypothetical protein